MMKVVLLIVEVLLMVKVDEGGVCGGQGVTGGISGGVVC